MSLSNLKDEEIQEGMEVLPNDRFREYHSDYVIQKTFGYYPWKISSIDKWGNIIIFSVEGIRTDWHRSNLQWNVK